MAMNVRFRPTMLDSKLNSVSLNQGPSLGLQVETFTRRYTYGQARTIKFLIGKFTKKLGLNKNMADIAMQLTSSGDAGYPDGYRVRIRYYERY